MSLDYLEFEKPIAELEEKILELQRVSDDRSMNFDGEIETMRLKNQELTAEIFSKLTPWQITQIARHPLRPYTLDYVERIVTEFQELHGDRMYSDDPAIVAGLGHIKGRPVAVIGHQKGRDTRERTRRNFGMPRPEGYRKAQRVMQLASRFGLPVVTFIDTAGAYPGVGAEERGQSEAIARSLEVMASLETPVVSVVIGEGGSGGALAIGVCDHLLMMEYAVYSVISPEGCASILWKSAEKASDAAEAMKMTTGELSEQGLVDEVIKEPLGGAHRNYDEAAAAVEDHIDRALSKLLGSPKETMLENRYRRLMALGRYELKSA
ncbi:MAG: acetyl-CoA carboxylase carboxyltransferase subunit alpha [Acidiferrobacterales bacterium]|nr:acetyl-CoA carboxylase carboxyltransferase subunit alpha [Acidiferrobacterales bacterium]